jgi:hypothetical protein
MVKALNIFSPPGSTGNVMRKGYNEMDLPPSKFALERLSFVK